MSLITMVDRIKESKRAYLMVLNNHCKGNVTRFAIYLDNGDGLKILWPYAKESLLPLQVYNVQWKQYPAFHFVVSGYQLNHYNEIRRMLKRFNPAIDIFNISGYQPSYT